MNSSPFVPVVLAAVAALALPPRSLAQTTQWSQPTTTEQWSAPSKTETGPAPARTGRWSEGTDLPAPRKGEARADGRRGAGEVRAAPRRAPPAVTGLDPRLVGRWSIRIPTAVGYRTDGRDVYQVITPGADRERLEVGPDGAYCWGKHCARAVPASPYYAMEGERYYEISDGADAYMLAFVEARGTVKLVYTGGGVMAEGHRAGR